MTSLVHVHITNSNLHTHFDNANKSMGEIRLILFMWMTLALCAYAIRELCIWRDGFGSCFVIHLGNQVRNFLQTHLVSEPEFANCASAPLVFSLSRPDLSKLVSHRVRDQFTPHFAKRHIFTGSCNRVGFIHIKVHRLHQCRHTCFLEAGRERFSMK